MRQHHTSTDARLKELVLYIVGKQPCDEASLASILFRVDFWSYCDRGQSVTGQEYVQRGDTPAPRHLGPALAELSAEKAVSIDRFLNLVAHRAPDVALFTDGEISFVDGLFPAT